MFHYNLSPFNGVLPRYFYLYYTTNVFNCQDKQRVCERIILEFLKLRLANQEKRRIVILLYLNSYSPHRFSIWINGVTIVTWVIEHIIFSFKLRCLYDSIIPSTCCTITFTRQTTGILFYNQY